MASIPQNHFNDNDLSDCVQRFFPKYHVGKLLAADIVNHDIRDMTDHERKNVFIIDDSLFNRTSCKKTELESKVFDHTDMHFKKSFRMLTLSWRDGNTLIPVNSCLLASAIPLFLFVPVCDKIDSMDIEKSP